MNGRATEPREPIDQRTSRSICDAVGERLQQDLRPQFITPSSYLEYLLEELRKRDDQGGFR
jgi:hypothetical protein